MISRGYLTEQFAKNFFIQTDFNVLVLNIIYIMFMYEKTVQFCLVLTVLNVNYKYY